MTDHFITHYNQGIYSSEDRARRQRMNDLDGAILSLESARSCLANCPDLAEVDFDLKTCLSILNREYVKAQGQ